MEPSQGGAAFDRVVRVKTDPLLFIYLGIDVPGEKILVAFDSKNPVPVRDVIRKLGLNPEEEGSSKRFFNIYLTLIILKAWF